jgi:ABC-type cobalt transport system substrate-binding protein
MVDESTDLETESAEEPESKDRRSLLGVIVAVIVIVIIVLVLLMLRSCDSGKNAGETKVGGKTIESVEGLPAKPGAISIWLAETSTIDNVLNAASIRSGDVVNVGGGRYVVTVPEGTETDMIARAKKVDGVLDAGRVYATGKAK